MEEEKNIDETSQETHESQDAPVEKPSITPESEEKPEKESFDPDVYREELRSELTNEYEERAKKQQEELVGKLSQVFGLQEETGDEKPVFKEGDNLNEFLDTYSDWQKRQEAKNAYEREQQEKERQNQIEEQSRLYVEQTKQGWEAQLQELESEGALPKVKNKDDKNDRGWKAREALFAKMNEINEEREKEGLPMTFNLHEVYHRFYKDTVEVSGGDAPVLGGSPKAATSGGMPSFEDLRSKNLEDLITG